MKVYFSIDDASVLDPDMQLRSLCSWHWCRWAKDDPCFAVAVPHKDSEVDDVVARLTQLGCDVLPALNDPDTPVQDKVKDKLKKHGINASDKTKDIAKKLHEAWGFPPLKPSYY
jgi:hypothetical protein